jgi:hypothetical protein
VYYAHLSAFRAHHFLRDDSDTQSTASGRSRGSGGSGGGSGGAPTAVNWAANYQEVHRDLQESMYFI